MRLALALALLCSCARELDWHQRQAELIGRIFDARHAHGFAASIVDQTSPRPGVHGVRLELRHPSLSDLAKPIDITCFEATPATRGHPRLPPRCQLDSLPPFDPRAPAPIATALVALVQSLRSWFGDVKDLRISHRSIGEGESRFVVRLSRGKFGFQVHCATNDPAAAPRRCRVALVGAPVELDEAARPGVHLKYCDGAGWGAPVLEPDDAAAAVSDERAQLLARELRRAPRVESVGFGPCCSSVGQAWCLTAHVQQGADLDDAAAALADVLRTISGPRLRVGIAYDIPTHPDSR